MVNDTVPIHATWQPRERRGSIGVYINKQRKESSFTASPAKQINLSNATIESNRGWSSSKQADDAKTLAYIWHRLGQRYSGLLTLQVHRVERYRPTASRISDVKVTTHRYIVFLDSCLRGVVHTCRDAGRKGGDTDDAWCIVLKRSRSLSPMTPTLLQCTTF